jgi:hypothetical protein
LVAVRHAEDEELAAFHRKRPEELHRELAEYEALKSGRARRLTAEGVGF